METFLQQSQEQFALFLMVLARVGGIMVFAPIYGSRAVPPQVKAGLSLLLAAVLSLTLRGSGAIAAIDLSFFFRIAGEVMIGMAVGYAATLIFEAVQVAGEVAGVQMGFGIVNVIDPVTSVQVSLIGQLKFMLAVLLFLAVNGHRVIVEAIGQSFLVIPPGRMAFESAIGWHFVSLFGQMLVVAVKLAAPVMVALLLASFAEGIIARTVPQINIFIVGFGIRIAFGIFVLMLSISFFVLVMSKQFSYLSLELEKVFLILAP